MSLASASLNLNFSRGPEVLDAQHPGHTAGLSESENFGFAIAPDEAVFHRVFFPENADLNYAGSGGVDDAFRLGNFPGLQNAPTGTPVAVQDRLGLALTFSTLRLIMVRIQPRVYFVGEKSSGVLTSNNTEIADGNEVEIDGTTYRFKDTPAMIFDVKRHGTTADTTLANLRAAINGTGTPGTEYFTGTTPHPTVRCSAVVAHALTITAAEYGVAGDAITTTTTATNLSWGAATLEDGVDTASPPVERGLEGTVMIKFENDILPGTTSSSTMTFDSPGMYVVAQGPWTPGATGRFTIHFNTTEASPANDQDVNAAVTLLMIGTP